MDEQAGTDDGPGDAQGLGGGGEGTQPPDEMTRADTPPQTGLSDDIWRSGAAGDGDQSPTDTSAVDAEPVDPLPDDADDDDPAEDDAVQVEEDKKAATLTAARLVIAGATIVALAFAAGFLGARAGAPPAAEPPPAPITTPSVEPTDDVQVLPAGADVRVGVGVPDTEHGEEGDVFIDIETADVYVRAESGWRRAGNIRSEAQENLTGDQGDQGEQGQQGESGQQGEDGQQGDQGEQGQEGEQGQQGDQGEQGQQGEQGDPGRDGTQVVLGTYSPTEACLNEGDVFVDTLKVRFYTCDSGQWVPVGV